MTRAKTKPVRYDADDVRAVCEAREKVFRAAMRVSCVWILPELNAAVVAYRKALARASRRARPIKPGSKGTVLIECKHGYDACPTCGAPKKKARVG